jgi:hypothetical protein
VDVTHRFEKTAFVRGGGRLLPAAFADWLACGARPQAAAPWLLASARVGQLFGEPLTAEEKELKMLPRSPLLPGMRVLTSGVLELKKELEDRQSKASE